MTERLKVLIADDEKIAREGLRDLVDWAELGMEVVFCAANGREALDYLCAHPVDVLLTGIKMPRMDGLELLQELSERGIGPAVIVFSGFSDFQYAQRAIRYGVLNYLLKPIRMGELTAALQQAAVRVRRAGAAQAPDVEEYARFKAQTRARAEELGRQVCLGGEGQARALCAQMEELFQREGYSAATFRKYAFQSLYTISKEVSRFTGGEDVLLEDTERMAALSLARTREETSGQFRACVDSLCGYVCRLKRSGKRRIIEELLTIPQHRFGDEELNLNGLAEQLGVTPNYLSALFRREMGQTFSAYLESCRIEKAQDLLRDVRYKVYEVAAAVGYSDPRHFGKVFKARTGRTPLEYRNRELGDE